MNSLKKLACAVGICLMLPVSSQASVITFNFTGGLVVANSLGDIAVNNGSPVTPIAASLTYDTITGIGSSGLSITMSDPFLGMPATLHDISMARQADSNLITGQVLVDWAGASNMPLHIEWDATGLFNAINYGLQAGDVISGTNLYHDANANGVFDSGEFLANVFSATPYSDTLQLQESYYGPLALQGYAPMAATSGSLGFGSETPFPGFRGYLDIGSGNSMHVVSVVTTVPIPAAAWLFGSGLLSLLGVARQHKIS